MLILRIKQAETALADGRLDEAYDLARRPDVREHRRGQRLITAIVEKLVDRGQSHLDAGHDEQALTDCDRAARLGGNQPRTTQLRAAAVAAITARQRQRRRRGQMINAAQKQIEQGRLTMGAQLLADVTTTSGSAGALLDDIAVRRATTDQALEQVQQALDRDALDAAITLLQPASQAQPHQDKVVQLTAKVCALVGQRVAADLNRGRIDLAESLLDRVAPLAEDDLTIKELDHAVQQCRLASWWLQQGDVAQACQTLRRLTQLLSQASWLDDAIGHAQQAAAARDAVHAGPLGLLREAEPGDDRLLDCGATTAVQSPPRSTNQVQPQVMSHNALPERFLMQVDGVGSYLVIGKASVSIGAVSSSRRPDIALLAQAGLPTATIQRMEDDYFLRSDGSVRVNDRKVTQKLLAPGDKIALGPRCSMKYDLPNAASTSAVIELSGAKLTRADTRKVVLLDRTMILGPGKAAHVRADELHQPIILQMRDGQLCHEGNALAMNEPARVGPMSIFLTEWS